MNYQYYDDDNLEENKTNQTISQVKQKLKNFARPELSTLKPTIMDIQSEKPDECNEFIHIEGTEFEIEELITFMGYERFVSWKNTKGMIPQRGLQIKNKQTQVQYTVTNINQYTFPVTICSQKGEVLDIHESEYYSSYERV